MTFAAIVRSQHAHASIKGFDTSAAADGVLAVYTGADIAEYDLGGLP